MANITVTGASTGSFNMTDEIRDIGNNKYLKVAMSDKSYYARLSTEKPANNNMFVIIDNTKYYVQQNPILFEPVHYEHDYGNFEQRFTVWLPKGRYLVEFNTTNTTTDTFTIPSGLNAMILYSYRRGNSVQLAIGSDGSRIFYKAREAGRHQTWFTLSRQGD
ncbi:MAG: hypothetical protein E6422_09410 [Veillonella sp.]|uniref:hypothetical protein n=1 Tax=Veillonella sp. TaxID=1926307 RepID=UPI00290DE2E7|nr:hypothetical protein [Veillonella sp.]MDU6788318.1 hypothetical protein [Veillonella sp.]